MSVDHRSALPQVPTGPAGSAGHRGSLVDLLDRASDGDVAAAGAVYDQVAESIYRIAVLMVRDLDEAQDVCRTTFTQVWREWSATHPARHPTHDGPVRNWLLATAYRGANERARQLSQARIEFDVASGL